MTLSHRPSPASAAVVAGFVALLALVSPPAVRAQAAQPAPSTEATPTTQAGPSVQPAQDKATLFVNVSTADPWRVASAVFFAAQFGLKEGHPTTLFVTVNAVPMFTQAKSKVRTKEFNTTVHSMLREYQALGGRILICKPCMVQLGIQDKDLIPGTEFATPQATNEVLFRPDTKVISW